MRRVRKQTRRAEMLTSDEKRTRDARKAMEADRAGWLLIGGQGAWAAELNRRRADRNRRCREHTHAVLAAKRAAVAAEPQPGLWEAA